MQAFEISTFNVSRRLAGPLVCVLLLLGSPLGSPTEALAAPPPSVGGGGSGPEQEACAGRAVGDACTLPNRQLGTCGQGTCNRLDYSQGSPPKAIEEACVVCQPASSGHEPPMVGTGGAPPDGDGSASTADSATGSATGSASTGSASTGSDKEPPQSSSRCRISDDDTGLVGLAALVLLGLLRRRTRAA